MTQLEQYGYMVGYLSKHAGQPELVGLPPPMKFGITQASTGGRNPRMGYLARKEMRGRLTLSERAELERLKQQALLNNPD